jgi:nucleotide-binding universal stress UspA family protein
MYRNLLVHIPTERSPRPAIDGSISLAMTCGADLEAIAVGYESVGEMSFAADGGVAIAPLFEAQHDQAVERAKAALAVFEYEAATAKIACRSRAVCGPFADAAEIVCATARLFDLTVVSQPETAQATFDNMLPQQILLQSGGPVLILPYTFRGAMNIGRVGILWDGGRLASRALRDAMPLVSRANTLLILTVNEPVSPESSPDRLSAHLAKRGLPAKTISFQADHSSIQPAILSAAADEGLDLLVMGGFGHSRLQEAVLGGVTRDMFRSMTVPTLMSH